MGGGGGGGWFKKKRDAMLLALASVREGVKKGDNEGSWLLCVIRRRKDGIHAACLVAASRATRRIVKG